MPTGAIPDIWTREAFVAVTGGQKARKKLQEIDRFLDAWAGTKRSIYSRQRYQCLMSLAGACEGYITRQEEKKRKKEAAFFTHPSQLLVNRIVQTKTLCEQVFRRLAYEMYAAHKAGVGGGRIGHMRHATGTQGLREGYQWERQEFDRLKAANHLGGVSGAPGVINPGGGSYLHAVHKSVVQNPLQQPAYNASAVNAIPPDILALGATDFDALQPNQLQRLHTFFASNPGRGEPGVYNPTAFAEYVHYIRKDERLSTGVILIPFGGKLRNVDGSLHSSDPGKVPGGVMGPGGYMIKVANAEAWVMDGYGNILTKEIARHRYEVGGLEVAQFNHSSLAAGNAVLCAGEILIHEGDVIEIDNNSGHYRPSGQMLSNALKIMEEEYDLDVCRTVTRVFDATPPGTVYNRVNPFWAVRPPN